MANTITVSNLYTLNVNSNTTFSTTINAVVPSTSTELFYKQINLGEEDSLDYDFTITISYDVKVSEVIVETLYHNEAYSQIYSTKNNVS